MRIFNGLEELVNLPNPVVTIGTFDGVHIGHQKILRMLNEAANNHKGESVLLTFHPHPRMVLYPESHCLKLLQTQDEKIDKLRKHGLQNLVILPFTTAFSRLSAIEFVRDVLVNKLHVRCLVIGYDHQFGRNREGGIAFLKSIEDTYGFDVQEISAETLNEINVSSTKIRHAIEAGEMETVKSYLGEPYELTGKVVKGEGLGRKIGYPTANIELTDTNKLLPKCGVYIVEINLKNQASYYGMMNVGVRPTVSELEKTSIEIHILDFKGDLYGDVISVRVLDRIRDEQKFESQEVLSNQLKKDEERVRTYFSLHR